jgi:hypothetical protein
VVLLGDSNQLYAGHGWDHGWAKALDTTFGTYATGIHWLGENFGAGNGVGYQCNTTANLGAGVFYYDGWANDPADPSAAGLRPCNTISLLSGNALFTVGMTLHANSPVYGAGDTLRGDVWLRTLGPGASVRPQFRLGAPPYTVLAQTGFISHVSSDLQQYTLTFSPSTNSNALDFRIGSQTFAPYQAYFSRITNTSKDSGVSVSTLYGYGGQSARDLAVTLRDLPDGWLINYFDTLKQQGNKIVIRVCMGLNDRVETLPSIKHGYPSTSMEAYYDNMSYITGNLIDALENGTIPGEYEIILTTPQPVSTPNNLQLESYISILSNKLVREHVRVFNLTSVTSHAEMLANGWYVNPGDTNHLSLPGYEQLSRREIDAILAQ